MKGARYELRMFTLGWIGVLIITLGRIFNDKNESISGIGRDWKIFVS